MEENKVDSEKSIILCFWVHSKYYFQDSKDKSSSIVVRSSFIITLYYVILIILGFFRFKQFEPDNVSRFILFKDRYFFELNRKLHLVDSIYKFVNSLSYLLMVNFYFMVIKEVILRKHVGKYFKDQ
jgi:hypothetical protein